jgi:hypothetical protein
MIQFYDRLFNEKVKQRLEEIILVLAVLGFAIHLALIFGKSYGLFQIRTPYEELLDNPISAIYTPFSFILIYEVYLLVYYLATSFSNSIGKQFVIIALIEVRNIFKDITKLKLELDWFAYKDNVVFTVDIVGFILLFYLIYWFFRLKDQHHSSEARIEVTSFIQSKKVISIFMLFVLAGLTTFNLVSWIIEVVDYQQGILSELRDVNTIFYVDFFNILIIVDVLILILSYRYTHRYSLLIRNSGFIISVVLIRLSFGSSTILNMALVLMGALFGVLIARIYLAMARMERE